MLGPKGPRRRPARPRPSSSSSSGALETVVIEPTSQRRPVGAPSRGVTTVAALSARPRLVDLAADWLSTVLAIGQVSEMPDAATLRTRALELKSRFERAAADEGFSAADVEDAVFAMVAFMDQTILNGRGAARDAWRANPLELELYRRQVAGEEFFDRLARLQQERESRIEALEVYCCCLAFGFTGRYVLSPPEHLVSILEELRRDISAVRGARPGPLAPNARHRAERVEEEARGMPWYVPVAFGLASTLLAFLIVWLFARVGAGNAASAVRSLIR